MNSILIALEGVFRNIPLPLLEVWGRFGFIAGAVLAVCAFGGITFRPGGTWGLGLQRYSWDSKALLSMALTSALIVVCGYIGSSIVIVPGAQTFESLKDLAVFICIMLFGYPALIIVPIAYGLSDLIEGVPPEFIREWWPGYLINPACFWIATQIIGKNPDFHLGKTWKNFGIFVVCFMLLEPPLWGYICSDEFTPRLSYRLISSALYFTTTMTWMLAPFAMLGALPLARKMGLFWAEIPSHVRERLLSSRVYLWESGRASPSSNLGVRGQDAGWEGVPLRVFMVSPFILLILMLVATTAYLTLHSSEKGAYGLASQIHEEGLENLKQRLKPGAAPTEIQSVLAASSIARFGRVLLFAKTEASVISSSEIATDSDDVVIATIRNFDESKIDLKNIKEPIEFRFDVITPKPLTRETWFARAIPYGENAVLIAEVPESYFLKGIQIGSSHTAMVLAIALSLSLVAAWYVSTTVTSPILQISHAATAIAAGHLASRAPCSRLTELGSLSTVFNYMANQLQNSFEDLHESEGRLNLAVKAASLGIWDWDIPRNILVWDEGMLHQYGIRPDEFHFSFVDWEQRVHPDDRERAKLDVERALRGECDFDSEFRVIWPDGSIHYIRGLAQTIRSQTGQPIRMVGVNFDVTQITRAKIELQKSRDEALRSYNVKSEFLSNMSHEIRTPLNSILGNAQLLQESAQESTMTEYQKSLVNVLIKSGDHLLTLINDILDLTMLESKGLTLAPAPFDLCDLAVSSVELLKAHASRKGIRLRTELPDVSPFYVMGDAHRLRQVILNLLQNAVKFTAQGEVVLRIEKIEDPERAHAIRFSVHDTGIGIPKDKLAAVFERFTQGNSSITKRFGGSGLGLSISRHLVELMGSDIEVESIEGVSTTFSFTINLDPAPVPDPEPTVSVVAPETKTAAATVAAAFVPQTVEPVPLPPAIEKKGAAGDAIKVLAVDDSEDNLMLIRNYMRNTNYVVELASDGRDAVEKFRKGHFDIVLMDIQMPVMDGYTAARAIRDVEAENHLLPIPIVALTAYALKEEERKSIDAGCDYHLAKPISKKSLLEAVANLYAKFKTKNPRQPPLGMKPALS